MRLIRPMLASLATDVPSGRQWVFEEKYDGIRALAYRQKGKVRLWSRNLLDLSAGFPAVVAAIATLPGGDLVLDGELVVFDTAGVSRFQLLQRRGSGARSAYVVFELLERDGRSLLKLPLAERRAALEAVIPAKGVLRLSRRMRKNGKTAYAMAQRRGGRGSSPRTRRPTTGPARAPAPGSRSRCVRDRSS